MLRRGAVGKLHHQFLLQVFQHVGRVRGRQAQVGVEREEFVFLLFPRPLHEALAVDLAEDRVGLAGFRRLEPDQFPAVVLDRLAGIAVTGGCEAFGEDFQAEFQQTPEQVPLDAVDALFVRD